MFLLRKRRSKLNKGYDKGQSQSFFDEGLSCFKNGNNRKALEYFLKAHELNMDSPRNASYYGRLLAVCAGDSARGLELCTWALRKEKEIAHHINLGKVYEISGNSMAAQRVYRLGLDYFPTSRELQEEYWGYSRKEPVVSFLERTHSLNRKLGILLRRVLPVWNDRYAVKLVGGRLELEEIRQRLISVFRKIADGKVTREGGALFLKDLLKRAEAGLVVEELERLTACPPPGIYVKTILHTLLLTRNDLFIGILSKFLMHEDEEMAGFAARGLAGFRSFDALKVLVRHLDHDGYLCRKAAAEALAEGFGRDGFEALKRHIMAVNGYMYKLASIEALLKSRDGVRALVEIMAFKETGGMSQIILAVVRGHVAQKPQGLDFLKKSLEEIVMAGGREAVLVTAEELIKALERSAKKMKNPFRVSFQMLSKPISSPHGS